METFGHKGVVKFCTDLGLVKTMGVLDCLQCISHAKNSIDGRHEGGMACRYRQWQVIDPHMKVDFLRQRKVMS